MPRVPPSADCLSLTAMYGFQDSGHALCVPLSASPQTRGWDTGDPQKALDERGNVCTGTPFLNYGVPEGCHRRRPVRQNDGNVTYILRMFS